MSALAGWVLGKCVFDLSLNPNPAVLRSNAGKSFESVWYEKRQPVEASQLSQILCKCNAGIFACMLMQKDWPIQNTEHPKGVD